MTNTFVNFHPLRNSDRQYSLKHLYRWLVSDLPERLKEELDKKCPNENRVNYLKTQIAQLNK